jgi:hypothetical protein
VAPLTALHMTLTLDVLSGLAITNGGGPNEAAFTT